MKGGSAARSKPFTAVTDRLLSVLIVPLAMVMKLYRRQTHALPVTTRRLQSLGVFPIRDHYYEPQFRLQDVARRALEPRELPGLVLEAQPQLDLLAELARFRPEIASLGWEEKRPDAGHFWIGNGLFGSGDAECLYAFLRHTQPRQVVEIGAGNSTRIIRAALARNQAETGTAGRHVAVEPYMQPWLEQLSDVEVVRKRVEDMPLDLFTGLEAGDLLFIDSSHMIRPRGDVLRIYQDILPRLARGVHVHIHDIFIPFDYPRFVFETNIFFWNEQYLVETMLAAAPERYTILAALRWLADSHPAELGAVCPYLTADREPGSLYLQIGTAGVA